MRLTSVLSSSTGLVSRLWQVRGAAPPLPDGPRLKANGLWGKWKTHWAIKKFTTRFFTSAMPGILRHALPWHHPSHVADPAWTKEWVALFDKGEIGLAKLDTSKLAQSPAGMLPA
jgi:hypothetical protein